jgi:hypothetical protein
LLLVLEERLIEALSAAPSLTKQDVSDMKRRELPFRIDKATVDAKRLR